jgi:hypothetical protein
MFNRTVMEKAISPCPLAIAGEEEKKINPHNKKNLA